MKKNKIVLSFVLFLITGSLLFFVPAKLFAVSSTPTAGKTSSTPTPTPTVSPKDSAIDNKIQELKDKLASRVAELNVVSQKIITGTIKTLSDEKIIINSNGSEVSMEVNEDTTYYELDSNYKRKEIKLESLKTGQQLIVWGSLNSSTNSLNSKTVYLEPDYVFFVGKVKAVDRKNFQITIADFENTNFTVDIEVSTRMSQYDASKGLVKSGFSKFAENQLVYVYATASTTGKKNLVSGNNLVILTEPTTITSSTPTPTKTK